MYTGTADHALTAELVSLVDVPVVASGDVTSRARRPVRCSRPPGAEAVMVGRGRTGQPLGAPGDRRRRLRPHRRAKRSSAELVLFIREAVRELGERRASGFLKKFYGWYLGQGRFPKPFKQELLRLESTEEVERRLLAAAPGALRDPGAARGRDSVAATRSRSSFRSRSTAAGDSVSRASGEGGRDA